MGYFAKKMDTYLSNNYNKKIAETTSNSIADEIADKITSISKTSSKKLQNNDEIEITKERYISPEKRQQVIDELG